MRQSKIDEYGLGEKLIELRQELNQKEASEVINKCYLPEGAEPISDMVISRWENNNGIKVDRKGPYQSLERFDALSEATKVKNRLERHCQKLAGIVEEVRKDEEKLSEIASVSNAYIASLDKLQKLNESVSKIQTEALKTEKVRTGISILMSVLNKFPEVKVEFMKEIKQHEEYDVFRSL